MRVHWLLVLSVASCSPYSFPKEVATIGSGVDGLSNSFSSGYDGLASDEVARVQRDLIDRQAPVAMSPSCRLAIGSELKTEAAQPCALFQKATKLPAQSDVEALRPATEKALAMLKGYANGMVSVTNATNRADFDAAVNQLSTAVGSLTANLDGVAPGLSTAAPAVVGALGWLVGAKLDEDRFAALKSAVNLVGTPDAQGVNPMHAIAGTLAIGLSTLSDARREVLQLEVEALIKPLGPKTDADVYEQRLTDANAALARLDALRRSDPEGAAMALETAHAALVVAVNAPQASPTALVKAAGDFARKAEALKSAFGGADEAPTASAKTTKKKGA